MIPKIIHYCWFGKEQKPDSFCEYLQSWKEHLPDYVFMEWNESNVDIETNTYVKQAYQLGKYAFVSDYARLFALYQYGGIYLDTDMEVLKSLNPFLPLDLFFGFESDDTVATCIIGSNKQNMHIKKLLDAYLCRVFIRLDGTHDLTTNVTRLTTYLIQQGLKGNNQKQTFQGITVFPSCYFCPKNFITEKLSITPETYAVHHFEGSWVDKRALRWYRLKQKIRQKITPEVYDRIRNKIKK